jgi:hypothetical protein
MAAHLVLAEWLKVEPQVLRFGPKVAKPMRQHGQRKTVDADLQRPAPQRQLIREGRLPFARGHPPEGRA